MSARTRSSFWRTHHGSAVRTWGLPWESVLFLAVLAGQLGVVLGLRARLLTKENLFLPPGSPRLTLLAAAPLYLPALRSILETEPLNLTGIGLAAATALTGFIAARFVRTAFHAQSRTTMISHD
ncbi:hypothetical protein [Streptomyces sp. NPDC003952]